MNTRKANLKKSGLFVLAASSFLVAGIPAQATDFILDSSDFSLTQGIGSPSAPPSSNINTLSPTDGFGNVFSEPFLLLGAEPTDPNIPNDSLNNNNSGAISNPFFLSEADASPGRNLGITFDWAFNGNATGSPGDRDSFNIFFAKEDFSVFEVVFPRDVSTDTGYGSNIGESALVSNSNLTEGNYQILIDLNENIVPNSSAAGFDNITIQTNIIPFEFSPGFGLLMAGGFWGVYYLLLKRTKVQLSKK